MSARLTQRQKETAHRLRAEGVFLQDIAHQLDCDQSGVSLIVRSRRSPVGGPDPWTPRSGRLSVDEREQILTGLAQAQSLSSIARSLGRSPSTISREVKANGGPDHYSVWKSHHRARDQTRRPKPSKLCRGPLLTEVSKRLGQLGSPKGDLGALTFDLSRQPRDAREPRNHLPVPLRSGPRRTAPRAGSLPALGAHAPQRSDGTSWREGHRHGDDQ
jgi:hypothetical protein